MAGEVYRDVDALRGLRVYTMPCAMSIVPETRGVFLMYHPVAGVEKSKCDGPTERARQNEP